MQVHSGVDFANAAADFTPGLGNIGTDEVQSCDFQPDGRGGANGKSDIVGMNRIEHVDDASSLGEVRCSLHADNAPGLRNGRARAALPRENSVGFLIQRHEPQLHARDTPRVTIFSFHEFGDRVNSIPRDGGGVLARRRNEFPLHDHQPVIIAVKITLQQILPLMNTRDGKGCTQFVVIAQVGVNGIAFPAFDGLEHQGIADLDRLLPRIGDILDDGETSDRQSDLRKDTHRDALVVRIVARQAQFVAEHGVHETSLAIPMSELNMTHGRTEPHARYPAAHRPLHHADRRGVQPHLTYHLAATLKHLRKLLGRSSRCDQPIDDLHGKRHGLARKREIATGKEQDRATFPRIARCDAVCGRYDVGLKLDALRELGDELGRIEGVAWRHRSGKLCVENWKRSSRQPLRRPIPGVTKCDRASHDGFGRVHIAPQALLQRLKLEHGTPRPCQSRFVSGRLRGSPLRRLPRIARRSAANPP